MSRRKLDDTECPRFPLWALRPVFTSQQVLNSIANIKVLPPFQDPPSTQSVVTFKPKASNVRFSLAQEFHTLPRNCAVSWKKLSTRHSLVKGFQSFGRLDPLMDWPRVRSFIGWSVWFFFFLVWKRCWQIYKILTLKILTMATRAPSLGKKKKICFLFSLFLNYPTTFFGRKED